MIFLPNYLRTERSGELYERHIFSRTIQCDDKTEQKQKRRKNKWWLNKLFIHPLGEDGKLIERFNPKTHNWQRRHKVPTLILNATTLNTGHNWQFTASWMGEPPAAIDTEIDANYRLRRMYYDEAPKRYRNVRLGHAVAASSCVPGLLEPLAMAGLYERKPEMIETNVKEKVVNPVVRLVDGGVNDNQGVVGLLEQDCSVVIVSDASGQMGVQDAPSRGLIGVPLRATAF
jgi:predicted acylesterase/phospholipase RssA